MTNPSSNTSAYNGTTLLPPTLSLAKKQSRKSSDLLGSNSSRKVRAPTISFF